MNEFEKAKFHAMELERIRKEKRALGQQPLTEGNPASRMASHLDRLKKDFKKERKKEINVHPERKLLDMGERHRQPVKCVETGEVFHSITKLANAIGLSIATVHVQITKGRKIKGLTYIKIDKNEE